VLSVNLYKNIDEFFLHKESQFPNHLFICPGPLVADSVRSLLGSTTETITIAKWVNDSLKLQNQEKIKKSELLLRLSSVWRHYFPVSQEQIFFRAFEIFTDLRSFTLDKDLLIDVLVELDADLKKSILLFWVYLETENLVDEQLAYKLVGANKEERPLCFIGFKHMNSIQIDMLKSQAEHREVVVAFPSDVYQETLMTDWIRWILPEQKLSFDKSSSVQESVKIYLYTKNKLNYFLEEFRKNQKKFDIVLPSQSVELKHIQEVLGKDAFFKKDVDLFQNSRGQVFAKLFKEEKQIPQIKLKALELKKQYIQLEDFKSLKICMLIDECLEVFSDLSDVIDQFFMSVMKEVVLLNSPRNFLVSITENENSHIIGLEDLRFKKNVNNVAVIASSAHGKLIAAEKPYNEKILNFLLTLGPLKRSKLDFLFNKDTLFNILRKKDSVLFLEEGLIENDLSWREVLKCFSYEYLNLEINFHLKKKRDVIKENIIFKKLETAPLSASRLQTYQDCPRKFYFNYIEKISQRPNERLTLDPDEKGIIEHKIIEEFFKLKTLYSFRNHENIARNVLENFIAKNNIKTSEQTKNEIFYEVLEHTKNGIFYLLDYQSKIPNSFFLFEVPINDATTGLKGAIDCLLISNNSAHIFDFKRSVTSIGSKKEIENFDKLQLWIYRWALKSKYEIQWCGYINLSDGSSLGIERANIIEPDPFDSHLFSLIERYRSETKFDPLPRAENICKYCDLNLICPKECL